MIARVQAPPAEARLPAVGFASPLPPGSVLRAYRVEGVIGQGGFGIVYRALRLVGGEPVAIKEYLPAQLAGRTADGWLAPAAPSCADTFTAGLHGFLDEAALLARVRHPGLVEVIEAWEQNGTAYMAMPLYDGMTLECLIRDHPGGVGADTLRRIVGPLLGALAAIHAAGHVHRDVSPDNVIVRPDGGAVLLDLGAARRVIGDRVRATTVMLKAGYAPIEQYADDPDYRIGPWSDVYALAAVMHHAMIDEPPAPAPLRVMRDTRVPLAARCPLGYDAPFVEAVDAAMSLKPESRPPSAQAFRERLGIAEEPAGTATILPPVAGDPHRSKTPAASARSRTMNPVRLAVLSGAVCVGSVWLWITAVPGPDTSVVIGDLPVLASRDVPAPVDERASVPAPPAASSAQASPATPAATPAATVVPGVAKAPAQTPAQIAAAKAAADARALAARTVTVKLAVSPWAEVWVDGVKRGVSPPMMAMQLPPGARSIELRNPGGGSVIRTIDAKAGQTVVVSHRFVQRERR